MTGAHESTPSDALLLERWQAGDIESGHALCKRYYATISRFFRLRIPSHVDARDLTQQTFLGIATKHSEIRDFRRFLYTVRSRRLKDYLRDVGRRRGRAEPYRTREDKHSGVETRVDRDKRKHTVRAALAELNPERFEALWLHYADELTATEIAEVLNLPPGTIKSRIRLGKTDLARALQSLKTGAPTLHEIFRINKPREDKP
ncbi:MAG: sigma-70 family RNA polymerase sigma factor [Myxococcales bacterium]|nr:sigma-70 family RNA polymerase sigma factor [Myxococcales bacterium]MCB9756526.1 sigma-70 family RNA polymerase sigma factor [Myxococcales bacterium]